MASSADESPIHYFFSGATAEENQVTLQGAGFGAYPQASVSFGYIPTDNAFDGATDGQGAIITAKPGEGAMIYGESVETSYAAMIRCSVRTEQAHAAIIIATIGEKPDQFVATNTPNNEAYFAGQYQRIAVFYTPPSTGFRPVIQIVNTSQSEALTAYIDNFEVYLLDPTKYYSAAFLDNDTVDPPVEQISVSSESEAAFSAGDSKTVTISGVDFLFRYCNTGSVKRETGETISVSNPFFMGQTEITQKQWKTIMGSIPSQIPADQQGDNMPVFYVTHGDCMNFVAAMNTKGKGTFRLPTSLEWEYACRAGTSTTYYWGENTGITGDYAWYYNNSGGKTHPVMQKKPNNWNLYDMQGNVCEWMANKPPNDTDEFYCLSGGTYHYYAIGCGSTINYTSMYYTSKSYDLGLRLIREPN